MHAKFQLSVYPSNIKMKYIATGYVSIGHLFECDGDDKNTMKNRKVLQKLLDHARATFDKSMIDKEHFTMFDTFFANLPVSIESASQFLHCILKQPNADDVLYQLAIEKLVWNIFRNSNKYLAGLCLKYKNSQVDEEDDCFRLFCIFNRFCETDFFPMSLTDKALHFMCSKFGVDTMDL